MTTCTGAADCPALAHVHGCFADNPCPHGLAEVTLEPAWVPSVGEEVIVDGSPAKRGVVVGPYPRPDGEPPMWEVRLTDDRRGAWPLSALEPVPWRPELGERVYVDPCMLDDWDGADPSPWFAIVTALDADTAMVQAEADPNHLVTVPVRAVQKAPRLTPKDPCASIEVFGVPFLNLPEQAQKLVRRYVERGLTFREWSPIDRQLLQDLIDGKPVLDPAQPVRLTLLHGEGRAVLDGHPAIPDQADAAPAWVLAWEAYGQANGLDLGPHARVLVGLYEALRAR